MNWTELVTQLESVGFRRREIATRAGCSIALINALATGRRGSNLNWRVADALRSLLVEVLAAKEVTKGLQPRPVEVMDSNSSCLEV